MRDRLNFTEVAGYVCTLTCTTKMGVQDKLVADGANPGGLRWSLVAVGRRHLTLPGFINLKLTCMVDGRQPVARAQIGLTMNSGISYKSIVYFSGKGYPLKIKNPGFETN